MSTTTRPGWWRSQKTLGRSGALMPTRFAPGHACGKGRLPDPYRRTGLLLQVLLEHRQHHPPVLLGVNPGGLRGVLVLGEGDLGALALVGKLDGHGMVVLRPVGLPGKRT